MSKDNPNLIKNGGTGSFFGKLLRKAKMVPELLEAVTTGNITKAIGIISKDPNNGGLTEDQAQEFFKEAEMYFKDKADARDMYKTTDHQVADFVAKRVIDYNLWVVLGAIIIEVLSVIYIEDKVLIAIISSAVGSFTTALLQERQQIIGFFFGSSKGSKDKSKLLKTLNSN